MVAFTAKKRFNSISRKIYNKTHLPGTKSTSHEIYIRIYSLHFYWTFHCTSLIFHNQKHSIDWIVIRYTYGAMQASLYHDHWKKLRVWNCRQTKILKQRSVCVHSANRNDLVDGLWGDLCIVCEFRRGNK